MLYVLLFSLLLPTTSGRRYFELAKKEFKLHHRAKAIKYIKKSCKKRYAEACFLMHSFTSDKAYIKKACSYGHGVACGGMGLEELNKGNTKKALKYLKKSCRLKFGSGCRAVADIYYGLLYKPKKAFGYYKKACKLKVSDSCIDAGRYYLRKKDYNTALQYLAKACRIDKPEVCIDIGGIFLSRKPPDYISALKFYSYACKKYKSYNACSAADIIERTIKH